MPLVYARSAGLALLTAMLLPQAARAAESYDNCTGFIASIPAVIDTQGVWCLNQNLSTAAGLGIAVSIEVNNVTIDCNDFKIGGLAGGDGTLMVGVKAVDRRNVVIRNCTIRGFAAGIDLSGGGHLVEDNRLDYSLRYGIVIRGDNNLIRRNSVLDTIGLPGGSFATAIDAEGDIIDNTVAGVVATGSASASGIMAATGSGHLVRDNRVRGLVPAGAGNVTGIHAGHDNAVIGNRLSATPVTSGYGIDGNGATSTFCADNAITGFSSGSIVSCQNAGGNITY